MSSNNNGNKRFFGLSQDTTFFLRKPGPIKKRELPSDEAIKPEKEAVVEEIIISSSSATNSSNSTNDISIVEIPDSTPQKPNHDLEFEAKKAKIVKSPSILDDLDPELLALISSSTEDEQVTEGSFKIDKTANRPISLKIEVRINNEQACQEVMMLSLGSQESFRNCIEKAGKKLKVSISQLILCTPQGVRVYPSSTPAILGTVDDTEFHLLDCRGYDKRKLRLQDELEKALAKKTESVEDELPTEEELIDEAKEEPPQSTNSGIVKILVKSKNAQQAKQVSVTKYDPIVPQILGQMEAEGKCRLDGQIISATATADSLDMEEDDLVDFILK